MKEIIILEEAYIDLEHAFDFDEFQESGAGSYFSDIILLDIEKLSISSGFHPKYFGYFRKLSSKFSFAIYYNDLEKLVEIHAILDLRRITKQINKNPP